MDDNDDNDEEKGKDNDDDSDYLNDLMPGAASAPHPTQ